MEEEINYISDKIEDVEHDIDICEYGLELKTHNTENLEKFQKEKKLLENILNYLTIKELKS